MANATPTFQWKTPPKTGYQINTVAMSDDGHILVTGTSQEYVSADDYAVYCYNTADGSSAELLWSDPLGQTSNQGVFWVAASGNGEYVAACGRYSSTSGFVRVYSVSGGLSSRFEYKTTSRVNQVSLSYDGNTLLAVDTDNIYLFSLISGEFQLTSQIKLDAYVDTCDISQDGQWIVAGAGVYSNNSKAVGENDTSRSSSDQSGVIYLCQNLNGSLTQLAQWQTASEVLRTVITRDGSYFAASTKTGEVTLFYQDGLSTTKRWSYTPDDYLVNLTYGLAITKTSNDDVYVGVGSNHGANPTVIDYGYAYLLKNIMTPEGYNATRLWIQQLAYCPNPGMNMDAEATYLTAAVGQPIFSDNDAKIEGAPKETPGVFYLFNNQTGETTFTYNTAVMSWPMTINSTATACFAGSDDGNIYYWGIPAAKSK